MMMGNLRFGILTTYEYWWVVELCSSGAVKISPAYCWSDQGECSVMAMLYYVICLARESVESQSYTAPQLPKVNLPKSKGDGESRGKENQDSNARRGGGPPGPAEGGGGKKKQGSGKSAGAGGRQAAGGAGRSGTGGLEFVRYLVEHTDRITFQARLEGAGGPGEGRLVVVKAYDTEEARDREAARFRELQGLRSLPAVVDERLELEWTDAEERRVHALVLAWVGPPDSGGPAVGTARRGGAGLPLEALSQVREALLAMHRRGVAHGDVRLPNLAWDPAARQAFVLDLSHALALRDAASPAEFNAECRADLQRVAELVEDARARAGPPARLVR